MSADSSRIHDLFRRLSRQLNKAATRVEPQNVHGFRTAARRVEAVLEVLNPEPKRNQRRLLKQLTRIRKRAGRVRDLDVHIAALRGLKVSDVPGHKTRLLQALSQMRAKREKRLVKSLDRETVREIKRRLARAEAEMKIPDSGFAGLAAQMVVNFSKEQGPVTEDMLHRYRVLGKRIRYVAELSEAPESRRLVFQLKRMQDSLGEWHDWLTLAERVKVLSVDGANKALLAALTNVTRSRFRDSVRVVTETRAAIFSKPSAIAATLKPAAATLRPTPELEVA
jgi:CHAD domain-containing protein